MDFKNYYLRNELSWQELTDDQIFSLQEKKQIEINGKHLGFSPRVASFRNEDGFVEMFEVSNTNVFLNSILNGVIYTSGEVGNAVGMPTITIPMNVVYAVRAVVSPVNYYFNNRFFPNIDDAIDYYNKLRAFIIEKQNDRKQIEESMKAVESDTK